MVFDAGWSGIKRLLLLLPLLLKLLAAATATAVAVAASMTTAAVKLQLPAIHAPVHEVINDE